MKDNRGQGTVIAIAVVVVVIAIVAVLYISWRGSPIGGFSPLGSPRAEVDIKVNRGGFTGESVSVTVTGVHVDQGLNFSLFPFIFSASYNVEVNAYNHDTGAYLSTKTVPVTVDYNSFTNVEVKWLNIDNCHDIDFRVNVIYTGSGATEASTTYECQW